MEGQFPYIVKTTKVQKVAGAGSLRLYRPLPLPLSLIADDGGEVCLFSFSHIQY